MQYECFCVFEKTLNMQTPNNSEDLPVFFFSVSSETVPEIVVVSPLKSQKVDLPPTPSTNSEAPIGRKGRLANLAATIGSWEDDLGHPPIRRDNAQAQPGTACVRPPAYAATNIKTKPSAAVEQPQSAPKALQKSVGGSHQVGNAKQQILCCDFIIQD